MNPTGYLGSFLTFPSTAMLPSLDKTISLASLAVRASFSLFLRRTLRGTHSLNLWGPWDGLVAQIPLTLLRSQCLGAWILFKCFLGPLFDYVNMYLPFKYIIKIHLNYLYSEINY
jgi:hypothetical protein